ncbi:unnamed protein product, partial [Amoebophrya sp. A25]
GSCLACKNASYGFTTKLGSRASTASYAACVAAPDPRGNQTKYSGAEIIELPARPLASCSG